MTHSQSEIDKEIIHLCETMGMNREQIRYVMINGVEFIGEAINPEELEVSFNHEEVKNETIFFHPMKINVEIDVDEESGHLTSQKYFTQFNPYGNQPYFPVKNYNILNQSPVFEDLMFEYLVSVYDSYFKIPYENAPKLLAASLEKNNIVYIKDFKKKL